MKSKNNEKHLTPFELSARWKNKITPDTLANWRSQGKGPRYFKAGASVLYPIDEIEKYERKNLIKV